MIEFIKDPTGELREYKFDSLKEHDIVCHPGLKIYLTLISKPNKYQRYKQFRKNGPTLIYKNDQHWYNNNKYQRIDGKSFERKDNTSISCFDWNNESIAEEEYWNK